MSPRVYPLEIGELVSHGDELLGLYSKGHRSAGAAFVADAFLTAARGHLASLGLDEGDGWKLDPSGVCFETWRCVPAPVAYEGERPSRFVPATPGSRGAFPVTVIRFDSDD